jgi:hypothetical protein
MAKVRKTLMHTRTVRGDVAGSVGIGLVVVGLVGIGPKRIPVAESEAKEGIKVMTAIEVVVPMVVAPMVVAPMVPMRAMMKARRGCTQAMTPKRAPASHSVFGA